MRDTVVAVLVVTVTTLPHGDIVPILPQDVLFLFLFLSPHMNFHTTARPVCINRFPLPRYTWWSRTTEVALQIGHRNAPQARVHGFTLKNIVFFAAIVKALRVKPSSDTSYATKACVYDADQSNSNAVFCEERFTLEDNQVLRSSARSVSHWKIIRKVCSTSTVSVNNIS